MFSQRIYIVYQRYIIKKKVRNKPMRYLLGIYRTYRSGRHIHFIYHVYTMYITCINLHGSDIPVIYNEYSLYILHGLSLVYTMYIPCIYMAYPQYICGRCNVYLLDTHSISQVYHYKKRVQNKPMMYLLGIYRTYWSGQHIHFIYHVYTMYIPCIYLHGSDIPVIYNESSLYILHGLSL